MDRYSDMAILVAVVDAGGFSPAARKLGMTHSAISKRVQRLEDRLGIQLLSRTTRMVALTDAGERYVREARPILADIQALEAAVLLDSDAPRGMLRVTSSNAFGHHHVVPAVVDFMRTYPDIKVNLTLTDAIVDLRHERIDVAIRSGAVSDPSLVAQKLASNERIICASPRYLELHGVPARPADLAEHLCLKLNFESRFNDWEFRSASNREIRLEGSFSCNSVEAIRTLCLAGAGIARLPEFMVRDDLKSGRLVALLQDISRASDSAIYALRAPSNFVPARTRAFIDFLSDRFASTLE
ncbi:LysR family transcriptional regulator [Pseudomonas sp. BN414]|nr:LysR family transcriptional regulator [Pseudomonas sp. BN414]